MSSHRLLIDLLDDRENLRRQLTHDDDNDSDDDGYSDDFSDIDEDEDIVMKLQQEFQQDLENLEFLHSCRLCGFDYQPKINMINYYCRMHIGIIYPDGTWSCCDQRIGTSGCRPSMHVSSIDLVESMKRNAANSILEIYTELIDYELIEYNENMITNYERGGDPSLILVKDKDGLLKRLEGKFYRIPRVVVHERIL